jgi:hypothetical protein
MLRLQSGGAKVMPKNRFHPVARQPARDARQARAAANAADLAELLIGFPPRMNRLKNIEVDTATRPN